MLPIIRLLCSMARFQTLCSIKVLFPSYGAMGAFIAQQQFLLQNLGNLNSGFGHKAGNAMEGSYSLPLPDISQLSNNPVQSHAAIMKSPKEETKAFDFISDHLAAARGSKRVT